MPQIEKEPKLNQLEIELVRNLSFNDFIDRAGKEFEKGRSGFLLLFSFKSDKGKFRPAAIQYSYRTRAELTPGFWIHRGDGGGSTLERDAVIFDRKKKTITFVSPSSGPDENTVYGIKINSNLQAKEFSGSSDQFPKIILEAKAKALNHRKESDKR